MNKKATASVVYERLSTVVRAEMNELGYPLDSMSPVQRNRVALAYLALGDAILGKKEEGDVHSGVREG